MNIVILKGNVGQDPRITTFENGNKVAQFSLATTRMGYKTKEGKEVEARTEWHNLVVMQKGLAGVVEKLVKKGTPMLVQGELRYRKFTGRDGNEREIAEVYVQEMELCGGKPKQDEAPAPAEEDFPFN